MENQLTPGDEAPEDAGLSPNAWMKNPILLVSCSDQRGLVHAVTGVLLKAGCNIVSNQEFVGEPSQSR